MKRVFVAAALGVVCVSAFAQGTFGNLGFENTTITAILANPVIGYYAYVATLPGWDWSPHENAGYGDPNTTVSFNDVALDAALVTLQGTTSPFAPAFVGNYSILLQGGTQFIPQQFGGASIFQTGSIPATARSLTYLGGAALQVTFNGQSLSPVALQTTPTYTEWAVDISRYAGQSGELRFAVPWETSSILDGIQFSSSLVPEPSTLALSGLGLGAMLVLRRRG